jgi:hypothetical protein
MYMKVFAVRDSAVGGFMNPFVAPAVGLAARSFADEVNRPDTPLNAHPEDYELFELGEFDSDSGRINAHPSPVSISRGKEVFIPKSSDSQLRLAK